MTPRQLANWRTTMGYSQAAAADALGLSLRQYARYERGEKDKNGKRWPIPLLVELATEALSRRNEK